MKITKEILKRMIKEELEGVHETYMADTGSKGVRYKNPTAPSNRMTPDDAIGLLEFGWKELTDDQRKQIEALAQSLRHSSDSGKASDFRAHSKDQYDKLIAAIEKAKGEQ